MVKKSETAIVFITNCMAFAKDLAWATRGRWDGFNAISISNPDAAAMETIANLFEADFGYKAEFCRVGDVCFLPNLTVSQIIDALLKDRVSREQGEVEFRLSSEPRSGKSLLMSQFILTYKERLS